MAVTTITEGLAELNTIQKRLEKKRAAVLNYLTRQEGIKDPLEKSGGSVKFIEQERQAIRDLETRHIRIRMAIQQVNQRTALRINGMEMTIAEWLTWRKEIASSEQGFLGQIRNAIDTVRRNAPRTGSTVVSATAVAGGTELKPQDYVVNLDEARLTAETEELEEILGTLDGKLSLHNATTTIEV